MCNQREAARNVCGNQKLLFIKPRAHISKKKACLMLLCVSVTCVQLCFLR